MDAPTLRTLITASGLSTSEWARTVAGRDERTVRRWLSGEPIPETMRDWLARLEATTASATSVTVTVSR